VGFRLRLIAFFYVIISTEFALSGFEIESAFPSLKNVSADSLEMMLQEYLKSESHPTNENVQLLQKIKDVSIAMGFAEKGDSVRDLQTREELSAVFEKYQSALRERVTRGPTTNVEYDNNLVGISMEGKAREWSVKEYEAMLAAALKGDPRDLRPVLNLDKPSPNLQKAIHNSSQLITDNFRSKIPQIDSSHGHSGFRPVRLNDPKDAYNSGLHPYSNPAHLLNSQPQLLKEYTDKLIQSKNATELGALSQLNLIPAERIPEIATTMSVSGDLSSKEHVAEAELVHSLYKKALKEKSVDAQVLNTLEEKMFQLLEVGHNSPHIPRQLQAMIATMGSNPNFGPEKVQKLINLKERYYQDYRIFSGLSNNEHYQKIIKEKFRQDIQNSTFGPDQKQILAQLKVDKDTLEEFTDTMTSHSLPKRLEYLSTVQGSSTISQNNKDYALQRMLENISLKDTKELSPTEQKQLINIYKQILNSKFSIGESNLNNLADIVEDKSFPLDVRQAAFYALAEKPEALKHAFTQRPKLANIVMSGEFNTSFLKDYQGDLSLLEAGVKAESLINDEQLRANPLCKRICDHAEKVLALNAEASPDYSFSHYTAESYLGATYSLRALYAVRAQKVCPGSEKLQKFSNEIRDGLANANLFKQPRNPTEVWLTKQLKTLHHAQQSSDDISSPSLYARQFFPLILDEFPLNAQVKTLRNVAQTTVLGELSASNIRHNDSNSPAGSSYLNTYAFSTSLLHLQQGKDLNREQIQSAYARLEAVATPILANQGSPLRVPYKLVSGNMDSPEGSYGRNVPFYLALYNGAPSDEAKQKYRKALEKSVEHFFTQLPDAMFYAKHAGAHVGPHARAPYYFYANLPYMTSALKILSRENSPQASKYKAMSKQVEEIMLSNFDDNGVYSIGLPRDASPSATTSLTDTTKTKDYNNALLGLSMLSFANRCIPPHASPDYQKEPNLGIFQEASH